MNAALGTEFGSTETPLATEASIVGGTVSATGDVTVDATSAAQINATVSNAATAENHGLFGAKSSAAGAVLATNKVSTTATALVADGSVLADGELSVSADDAAGIYSNVKIVSTAVTTTDSGVHFLGKYLNGDVPSDFDTGDGVQDIAFGDTVRILHNYAKEQYTTDNTIAVLFTPS